MGIQWDFQTALYDALTTDSALMALVRSVGDWPDPDQELPHVTIGDGSSVGMVDKSGDGIQIDAQVHVWSDYDGWKEAKRIADEIRRILGLNTIDMTSFGYCNLGRGLQIQANNQLIEDGGRVRHIVLPFRFLLKKIL